MKLTDIPPHITEIDPPYFFRTYYAKYKIPVDVENVIPRYNLDYYDGALSGIIKVHDHHFYAKAVYPEDRKYWAAWELTEEELTKELNRHKLFQQYVGGHTDYFMDADENWIRDLGKVNLDEKEWRKFYNDPNIPQVDYNVVESREIFGIMRNPFYNW